MFLVHNLLSLRTAPTRRCEYQQTGTLLVSLLCDQVTSPQPRAPPTMEECGGCWGSKPLKSYCCPSSHMQCCTTWGVPGASTRISLDGWGWGRVGEAAGVPMAVFLLVKMISRPQLLPLYISTCHRDQPQYASATQAQFSRGHTPCSVSDTRFCSFPWDSLLALGEWGEAASLPDPAFRTQLLHPYSVSLCPGFCCSISICWFLPFPQAPRELWTPPAVPSLFSLSSTPLHPDLPTFRSVYVLVWESSVGL